MTGTRLRWGGGRSEGESYVGAVDSLHVVDPPRPKSGASRLARARLGSSTDTRRHWTARYAESPYRELPWFDVRPHPDVVRAVDEGFLRRKRSLLDIGCGAGTNLLWLAQQGFRMHGIDLAPGAVDAVRRRAASRRLRVDVRVGDALALPFAARSLDGGLDVGCFHTLPFRRRAQYADELARVMRPGGTFLLLWVAREHTGALGPPHRPSVEEVSGIFERQFLLREVRFRPSARTWQFAAYSAWLERRTAPQPPRQ